MILASFVLGYLVGLGFDHATQYQHTVFNTKESIYAMTGVGASIITLLVLVLTGYQSLTIATFLVLLIATISINVIVYFTYKNYHRSGSLFKTNHNKYMYPSNEYTNSY